MLNDTTGTQSVKSIICMFLQQINSKQKGGGNIYRLKKTYKTHQQNTMCSSYWDDVKIKSKINIHETIREIQISSI